MVHADLKVTQNDQKIIEKIDKADKELSGDNYKKFEDDIKKYVEKMNLIFQVFNRPKIIEIPPEMTHKEPEKLIYLKPIGIDKPDDFFRHGDINNLMGILSEYKDGSFQAKE